MNVNGQIIQMWLELVIYQRKQLFSSFPVVVYRVSNAPMENLGQVVMEILEVQHLFLLLKKKSKFIPSKRFSKNFFFVDRVL